MIDLKRRKGLIDGCWFCCDIPAEALLAFDMYTKISNSLLTEFKDIELINMLKV